MHDTFIQFNQQIEVFQQFLTVASVVLEVYLGLIALSWFVSSILANEITVETQVQTETTPSEEAVRLAEELSVVSPEPLVAKIPTQQVELDDHSVKELRQMAKDIGLSGYSRLPKHKLVAELQGAYSIGMVPA